VWLWGIVSARFREPFDFRLYLCKLAMQAGKLAFERYDCEVTLSQSRLNSAKV
jgi:hypothetical protein